MQKARLREEERNQPKGEAPPESSSPASSVWEERSASGAARAGGSGGAASISTSAFSCSSSLTAALPSRPAVSPSSTCRELYHMPTVLISKLLDGGNPVQDRMQQCMQHIRSARSRSYITHTHSMGMSTRYAVGFAMRFRHAQLRQGRAQMTTGGNLAERKSRLPLITPTADKPVAIQATWNMLLMHQLTCVSEGSSICGRISRLCSGWVLIKGARQLCCISSQRGFLLLHNQKGAVQQGAPSWLAETKSARL